MKLTWLGAFIFSILSGAAWVAAQTSSPSPVHSTVKPVMNMNPDTGETRKIEIDQTKIRDYAFHIETARKHLVRDNQKLADDTLKLLDARSVKDEVSISKAKTDIKNDQAAIEKDRDLLKKNIREKIKDDEILLQRFNEKVSVARNYLRRDSKKMAADTNELEDARARYVATEIETKKADIENDQNTVKADTDQLNQDLIDQAASVDQLAADRRHLDAANNNLNEDNDTSESLKYKNRDTDAK